MERALPATERLASLREQSAVSSLLTNLSRREIPSLFGLRGMAALAVVIYHYSEQRGIMALFPGPFAVTLFFELSGLLITWLLLKEIDKTGGLNLPSSMPAAHCGCSPSSMWCGFFTVWRDHFPEVGQRSSTWAI